MPRIEIAFVTGPFEIENGRGFDFDSGFGFVDGVKAIQLISGFRESPRPLPTSVGRGSG